MQDITINKKFSKNSSRGADKFLKSVIFYIIASAFEFTLSNTFGICLRVKFDISSINLDTIYNRTELFLLTRSTIYIAFSREYGCFLKIFLLRSLVSAFCCMIKSSYMNEQLNNSFFSNIFYISIIDLRYFF